MVHLFVLISTSAQYAINIFFFICTPICVVYSTLYLLSMKYFHVMPIFHGAMGCDQKNLKLVWQCHQLLSGFLAKDLWPRVSR